jgi:hydrogenase-4 component F
MTDPMLLALLGVPLVAAGLTLLLRRPAALHGTAVASQVVVLVVAVILMRTLLGGRPPEAFDRWLYLDDLGGVVLLIIGLVGLTAAIYSSGYLQHELFEGAITERELRKYYALFHIFLFTMLLTSVSGNLGVLWTAIAATTIASAPLVDFYGSREPLEAAWKYIVLTTAGSMVALLGFLLVYQAGTPVLGTSYDFAFPSLLPVASRLSPGLLGSAFVLVLVGLGTKSGLAPMHAWLPDAHSQAPSPVCALLSGVELNCAMLGILRVYALAAPSAGPTHLRWALIAFGLVSMVVAVAFLLSQRDYKRLLAYSSIEQMGLVALGVGLGAPLALFGALLQMVNHGLTKSLMFFATGNLLLRFRTRTIESVSGVVREMPGTAILLVAGSAAIAGAPPFGLFISEVSILAGGFSSGQWAVTGVVAILLVIGFMALMAPFNRMVFRSSGRSVDVAGSEINAVALIPAYLSLGAVLVLGVWVPGPLHQLISGAMGVLER